MGRWDTNLKGGKSRLKRGKKVDRKECSWREAGEEEIEIERVRVDRGRSKGR